MARGGGGPGGESGGGSSSEAATFVVSPIPGVGDYLTIQDALDNLPAEGGYILVREGTYSLSAQNDLPDKPVILKGCGRGSTVIDLGANDIAAFSSAFAQKYVIRDLSVVGNSGQDAIFLSLDDDAEVLVENVGTEDIRTIVFPQTQPEVIFNDCEFEMPNQSNISFWRGQGTGGELTWNYVEATVPLDSNFAIGGQPDFTVIDSYLGGGPTISTYDVGKILFQGFTYDHALFQLNQPNSRVANVVGTDVSFTMRAKGLSIVGSDFVAVAETNPLISLSSIAGALNLRTSGVTFDGGGVQQFMVLIAAASAAITFISVASCIFSAGVTAFLDLTTATLAWTDNQSDGSVPFLDGADITLLGSPTYAFNNDGPLVAGALLTSPGKSQPVTKVTGQVEGAPAGSAMTVDVLLILRSDGSTVATVGTLTIAAGDLAGTVFFATPVDVPDTHALKGDVTEPGSGTPASDLVMLVS